MGLYLKILPFMPSQVVKYQVLTLTYSLTHLLTLTHSYSLLLTHSYSLLLTHSYSLTLIALVGCTSAATEVYATAALVNVNAFVIGVVPTASARSANEGIAVIIL